LGFAKRGGASVLARRSHRGPLVVQRPFYPEGPAVCHVYLLHPPGGLVPGDALTIDVTAADEAHVLLTAPAATKIYRSDGRVSSLTQSFRAQKGTALEWLPPETIVFEGARAEVSTRVELAGDASFLGWEIVCLGRPACAVGPWTGRGAFHVELWRDERPLVIERVAIGPDVAAAGWGLRKAPVLGTLLAAWPGVDAVAPADLFAGLAAATPGDCLSFTRVRGALVVRYLGGSTERARTSFERAWATLRPLALRRPACVPRIWTT
jgi:urease accessory protein